MLGKVIMKSMTIKELKNELEGRDENIEVFILNEGTMNFEGLTRVFDLHSVKDNGQYLMLTTKDGDIISI